MVFRAAGSVIERKASGFVHGKTTGQVSVTGGDNCSFFLREFFYSLFAGHCPLFRGPARKMKHKKAKK
jgi:hypothetical protein